LPADYTIANLDAVQAGSAAADTILDVANTARNAACSFFKAYPSVVIPNPAFDFLDATWDGLCKNSQPGLPPPPTAPFPGGQCVCTAYTIHFTINYTIFGTAQSPLSASNIFYGPLGAPYLGPPNAQGNITQIYIVTRDESGSGCGTTSSPKQLYGFGPYYYNITSYTIDSITGSPDNCGSLPLKYPPPTTPPTPTTPGGNTYNLPNVSLTFNNGLNFSVAPQITLDPNFGPTLNIGNLNISVGGGGVTVSPPPSLSGPTININNTNLLNNLTNNLNTTNNNVNNVNNNVNNVNSNVNNVNTNVNNVNTNVNNVNNNVNTVNNNVNNVATAVNAVNSTVNSINGNVLAIAGTLNGVSGVVNNVLVLATGINKHTKPTPKPSDSGITTITVGAGVYTVTGLSNLISAQVILTTLPTKSEIRFGADPAYNVYVAGFFAWLQGTEAIQRIPLQYAHNINFAPPGADGYSYTLVNGAAGYSIYSEDNS
jgi:archaellum component FlaC